MREAMFERHEQSSQKRGDVLVNSGRDEVGAVGKPRTGCHLVRVLGVRVEALP